MTAAENVCYTLINVQSDSEPPSEVSLKADLGRDITFHVVLKFKAFLNWSRLITHDHTGDARSEFIKLIRKREWRPG